ncbi:hypothetical protein CSB20_09160 [bacterium DOLZORAL124_64_63]|nr:MAG: hypothetical protein CSB20_09160 [bacterium DOLZORAL124_64_63]
MKTLLPLILILSFLTGPALAGPVHDPFVQDFQVGAFDKVADVELIHGFPAGLLQPAVVDTLWLKTGLDILHQEAAADSPHLTLRLLAALPAAFQENSWRSWHALRHDQMLAWQDSLDTSGRYLLADRLRMGFFRALDQDKPQEARRLAARLEKEHAPLGLPVREGFIWELRRRLLDTLLEKEGADGFWNSILPLGTFDTSTAWTLWRAHCAAFGSPLLPSVLNTRAEAVDLAGLRHSGLREKDLRQSAFPEDVKAALGARLLRDQELTRHLGHYPNPPDGNQMQGWWVYGQRMSRRGVTAHYEQLAANPALNAGWRLDVWRRASEIHLIAGRWEPGLQDLRQALDLAQEGSGSKGLRRRLRQWCEQALVLALAKDKEDTARQIHTWALEAFPGQEKATFAAATEHWFPDSTRTPAPLTERIPRAREVALRGSSADLVAASPERKAAFAAAADHPLWTLWARWGMALLSAEDHPAYVAALRRCHDAPDPAGQEALAIEAVASLLDGPLPAETILRWTLNKDIHHQTAGQALTGNTPLAELARANRDKALVLHGLLGVALLADDLRAIVGAATPLPAEGLTTDEKLCFLYPLPRRGAVRQALDGADNDPALILAVARNESLFEGAVRSRAGALGFMQIMPFHFPGKGARPGAENWSNAAVSIARGDALLTENRRRYDGNAYLSLAAYNAGPGAVARWQKQLGGPTDNPVFMAWIGYPETRHYVEKVLRDREIYDWIIRAGRGQ